MNKYKYANATNSNYIKYAEASSITNITGDYKGNAVAYRAFDVYRDEYSLYNDYKDVIPSSEVETYVKMTNAWINDVDAKPNKVWKYFVD